MLERLWAGWRSDYVTATDAAHLEGADCVFCAILGSGLPDEETYVLWRGQHTFAILNAYPYGSGHLLVMPFREVAELAALTDDEHAALWSTVRDAVTAVTAAYSPHGVNIGANLGEAAGAGVPGHLHIHVLPRWHADSNFMTAIAETRVLPEALEQSWAKLTAAWPTG